MILHSIRILTAFLIIEIIRIALQEIIVKYIELLQEKEIFSNEIVTEIKPLEKFYYAEEYHQNYEKYNPNNPYVRQVSIPRLRKFQNAYPELLKENH